MPPAVVFADTFYWVAVLHPRDPFHARVMACGRSHGSVRLRTTDEVLTEVLNWFSGSGPYWRVEAARLIHDLRNDATVDVFPHTRADFDAALAFYESRPDKAYSLTDCRSMLAMRGHGISDALTNDRHFGQEGFTVIFQAP